jgi:hypothetical protein
MVIWLERYIYLPLLWDICVNIRKKEPLGAPNPWECQGSKVLGIFFFAAHLSWTHLQGGVNITLSHIKLLNPQRTVNNLCKNYYSYYVVSITLLIINSMLSSFFIYSFLA